MADNTRAQALMLQAQARQRQLELQQGQQVSPGPQNNQQEGFSPSNAIKFAYNELRGMGEAALNIGTTTASTLSLAPAMGLSVAIDGFIDGDNFSKIVEDTKNAAMPLIGIGYQPMTERGRAYTESINQIGSAMQQGAESIAGMNTGPQGTVDPQLISVRRGLNALVGPEAVNDLNLWVIPALVETGLEMVPGVISGSTLSGVTRGTPRGGALSNDLRQMRQDRSDARQRTENLGIETGFVSSRLQTDPERLEGLQESAQRILGRQATSNEDLEIIAQRLVALEREERGIVNSLYESARSRGRNASPESRPILSMDGTTTNNVPAGALVEDVTMLRRYYDRLLGDDGMAFDVEDLPVASRRLAKLDEIISSGDNRIIMLNKLEQWRKGNNANRPRGEQGKSPVERKVLGLLNSRYDNYMDNLYARDMLTGDRDTLRSWQMARGAAKRHAERFFNDNFVERLQDLELSAADVKQIVYGASATGAKASSIRAVRELKEIFGTSSDQWRALKGSIIFDLTKPLAKENPRVGDFQKFSKDINKLFDDRKELLDEMFSPSEIQTIRDMQRVATKMEELTPNKKMFDISLGFARFFAGSNLARAQQRVGLTAGATRRAFTFLSDKRRADYINAIAGYDVMAPLVPKRVAAIPAAIESQASQSEARQ